MSLLRPGKPYRDAAKQDQDYFNQIMQQEQAAQAQEQPFIDVGKSVAPDLTGAMQQLLNPEQLTAKWASEYQTSPYAQNILNQTQARGADIASQQGLTGSSAALQNIQNESGKIITSDEEGFLNNLMQKYMAGVGLGENLYNRGATSAATLGQQALTMGNQEMNMADILGALQMGGEQAGPTALGKLVGSIAHGAGGYLTGDFGKGGYGRGQFAPVSRTNINITPGWQVS